MICRKKSSRNSGSIWTPLLLIDSALSGDTLVERDVLTKIRLIRDYFQYQALVRIATNTIRSIEKHSNKIVNIVRNLPAGSIVLADPEYDARGELPGCRRISYRASRWNSGRGMPESPEERQLEAVSMERSTAGENLVSDRSGIPESGRSKCYYKLPESKLKGAVIIGCTHNIIAYFKNKAWCSRFVKL